MLLYKLPKVEVYNLERALNYAFFKTTPIKNSPSLFPAFIRGFILFLVHFVKFMIISFAFPRTQIFLF